MQNLDRIFITKCTFFISVYISPSVFHPLTYEGGVDLNRYVYVYKVFLLHYKTLLYELLIHLFEKLRYRKFEMIYILLSTLLVAKTQKMGPRETAQQLRALAALPKDWSSIPSTHVG